MLGGHINQQSTPKQFTITLTQMQYIRTHLPDLLPLPPFPHMPLSLLLKPIEMSLVSFSHISVVHHALGMLSLVATSRPSSIGNFSTAPRRRHL